MKKIFKYLNLLFVSLLGIFALVSCGEEKNDSNLPKLSDEEIQANFNEEVSKGISKDGINSIIGEAVNKASDSELLAMVDSINVPNTKATITAYGAGESAGDSAQLLEGYVWQKDRVIYVASDQSDAYYLDLNTVKDILDSTSSTTTQGENVDYVGTIISSLGLEVDVDTILTLINVSGSDFTYSDGYFTLKEETIINKMVSYGMQTSAAQTLYKSYVNSLTVKLGYDGYHFTGLVLEYVPGTALAESVDVSKTYVKLNVKLGYNEHDLTSVSLNVDLSVIGTNSEVLKVNGTISASDSALSINGKFEFAEKHTGKYSGTVKLEVTTKSVSLEANVEGYASNRDVDDNGVVSYSYDTEKHSISVNLEVTETSILGSASFDSVKAVEVSGTVANSCIKSLTANVSGSLISSEVEKIEVVVTTDNVTIPAEFIAEEETARNILNWAC